MIPTLLHATTCQFFSTSLHPLYIPHLHPLLQRLALTLPYHPISLMMLHRICHHRSHRLICLLLICTHRFLQYTTQFRVQSIIVIKSVSCMSGQDNVIETLIRWHFVKMATMNIKNRLYLLSSKLTWEMKFDRTSWFSSISPKERISTAIWSFDNINASLNSISSRNFYLNNFGFSLIGLPTKAIIRVLPFVFSLCLRTSYTVKRKHNMLLEPSLDHDTGRIPPFSPVASLKFPIYIVRE